MNAPAAQAGARRVRIGRYVVLGRLGRGGMGMVYRGLDESLEREVALKILTQEGLLDSDSRKRFGVEAKAAAQLQHPNIVTIYELGEERGIPFIAMELLPGVDLEGLLRSGEQLLLAEKLDVLAQVCRGLAYAHERRIVHRDIKPSNIRLLDDGSVKIMDFGIAKLGGVNLTQSGMVVGTVHYMSPEQIRGRPLDGRSDLFSAGVMLHELLTGVRPFDGASATEILYKIVHTPAPAVPLPAEAAAAGLQRVLDRALAKEPEERFANAAQMADELHEVQAAFVAAHGRDDEERVLETVAAARRMLKEGRADEGVARLSSATQAFPQNLELRRALRSALRQKSGTGPRPAPEEDGFPELAATFHLPSTQRAPETVRVEAETRAVPGATVHRGWVWLGLGLAALSAIVILLLLLYGGAPPVVRLAVRSEPTGARVFVDGKDTGVVTNGGLSLDGASQSVEVVFRKDGYQDASRTVTLPPKDEAVVVTLTPAAGAPGAASGTPLRIVSDPAGATVSVDGRTVPGVTPLVVTLDRGRAHKVVATLDGHTTREESLLAGHKGGELVLRLSAAGPVSQVTITSSYPLDVIWNGKTVARAAAAPRVSLPPGRHTLMLVAPTYGLRTNVTVEARGGAPLAVNAPGLGRINIQARPDNCEVSINGVFADYPPIHDRPIVAGAHRVQFKWPDGRSKEEPVQVEEGRSVFVTGRPE